MIVNIPNWKNLNIKYLVFDYNGSVAEDGLVIDDFIRRIKDLKDLKAYVITADTYKTVREQFAASGIEVKIISKESGSRDKVEFVELLGKENVVAFGNGNNDRLMLEQAAVGICIMGPEGCSKKALTASDLVVRSLDEALQLIESPIRLIAGLRE